MELFKLVNHYCKETLSVELSRFIKCYEVTSSQRIKQFDTFEEYAQFKKKSTLSFDEMVEEIQLLINNDYHINWIDFTLYYISASTAYILFHVIVDDHAVEPQYHIGVINPLNDQLALNDYVDNMARLMEKK